MQRLNKAGNSVRILAKASVNADKILSVCGSTEKFAFQKTKSNSTAHMNITGNVTILNQKQSLYKPYKQKHKGLQRTI